MTTRVRSVTRSQNNWFDEKLYDYVPLDKMTGLLTISSFAYESGRLLRDGAEPEDRHFAVIFLGMVDFKGVNEKIGFEGGNQILTSFARDLKTVFRGRPCARAGGDSFLALVYADEVEDGVEEMREILAGEYEWLNLRFRAGVYVFKDQNESPVLAGDKAKLAAQCCPPQAIYGISSYDEKLDRQVHKKRYIIEHLEEAIEKGWIVNYYQPVIRTISGQLCGVEALARWNDPEYGFMNPGDFIEILEDASLIFKLDLAVIRNACRDYTRCLAKYGNSVPFSVNLSRSDFESCDIFTELLKIVDSFSIPHNSIHVELTESLLIGDEEYMKRQIEKFHAAGFSVWMDDFGSGYSSLNILKDFDFDLIKIDMIFLKDFNSRSRIIIPAVLNMSKKMGFGTLAEGVETEEHVKALRDWGCDRMQGFYYSKPIPLEDPYWDEMAEQSETPEDRAYHDQINQINVLNSAILERRIRPDGTSLRTSRPVAILELNNDRFSYIYHNDPYEYVLKGIGLSGTEEAIQWMNNPEWNYYSLVRKAVWQMDAGSHEFEVKEMLLHHDRCIVTAKFLAADSHRRAVLLSIRDESEDLYDKGNLSFESGSNCETQAAKSG